MTPADAFDAAFSSRARHYALRPETAADGDFLAHLFERCSPLARLLPNAVIAQQAAIRQASHSAHHPHAMRRIVIRDARPIGRIMIDWEAPGHSHGVDIAMLPDCRTGAAGLHLLRAWLTVADQARMTCSLEVEQRNPAARLYARLGFATVGDPAAVPIVSMARAVSHGATRQ